MLVVLADNTAHTFAIEGQHRMIAEPLHVAAELNGRLLRQKVAVKQFAAGRARYPAIRADEPQVEAQRLRDRHGKLVPAAGSQCDLDAGFVCPAQCVQVGGRDLDLWNPGACHRYQWR